jgi:hypothetical protein
MALIKKNTSTMMIKRKELERYWNMPASLGRWLGVIWGRGLTVSCEQ